jgi:hypothetical protein
MSFHLHSCTPEAQSSSQVMGKHNRFSNDSFGDSDQPLPDNFNPSSRGLNVTGGDALSVLLQQKLQELTLRVDSSHDNLVREGTCATLASSLQDSVPNVVSSKSREQNKRFQFGLHRNKFDSIHESHDYDYSSVDDLPQNVNHQRQQVCLLCLYHSAEAIILFFVFLDFEFSPLVVFYDQVTN